MLFAYWDVCGFSLKSVGSLLSLNLKDPHCKNLKISGRVIECEIKVTTELLSAGRKRMEEVFHSPCDRSEFYNMANLSSAPVFFRPTYQTGEFQQCVSTQIYRPCVAYHKGNFSLFLFFNLIFLKIVLLLIFMHIFSAKKMLPSRIFSYYFIFNILC